MDKEAFSRQVTAMQTSLYRVAASYLRGEADRLDAVSEAIARAWEKRGTLRDERYFKTWMTRILFRTPGAVRTFTLSVLQMEPVAVPVETLPEQISDDAAYDRVNLLRWALEQLPQRQRTMIVLHYMEGYDVNETARIIGTTKGAVCAGLSRARDTLRTLIGEEIR